MPEHEQPRQMEPRVEDHKDLGLPRPTNILTPQQAEMIFPGIVAQEGRVPRSVERRVLLCNRIEVGEGPRGIRLTPVNSTLGLIELPTQDNAKRFGVVGNTVQRLCPHGDCSGHAGEALSSAQRRDSNCATANIEDAFRKAGQEDSKGRFMLLPTRDDVVVVGKDENDSSAFMIADERGHQRVAFNKLRAARAVVIGEKWANEQGLKSITAGINGADRQFLSNAPKR